MRLLPSALGVTLCAALLLSTVATAQEEGCCQYSVWNGNQKERRCADLSEQPCAVLKPFSSFFRGLKCDGQVQRCVRGAPTATPTRTAAPTRTPTPRPQSLVSGCCQVSDRHNIGQSVCGNDVVESTCIEVFGERAEFCERCACSSHDTSGFSRDPGECVAWTPAPTRTPTATPVRAPLGCCQLDNLRRLDYSVCGNDIAQPSCLGDYAGDRSFCLDCACSSHDGSGFSLAPGACVTRTPTPTPVLGCCEIANFRGGHESICGTVTEAVCQADRRGAPAFCANCVCSSHSAPGFDASRGSCIAKRRQRLPGPHVPHIPHNPR